ncbi:MAG: carboxy terminal-processing peptidase [Flavobacteriales bacterium]
MKHHKFLILLICGAAFALSMTCSSSLLGSDKDKKILVQELVFQGLKQRHYHPPKLDDTFSKQAFEEYIETLDYGKQFFLKSDVDYLRAFELEIDDLIRSRRIDFYTAAQAVLKRRRSIAQGYYKAILAEPMDFSSDEYYETDRDSRTFAASEEELKHRWASYLKFSCLSKLYSKTKSNAKKDKEEQQTPEALEQSVRESVLKNMDDWFSRLSKIKDEDQFETYINALLEVADPHTVYMAPKTNEDFNISMSGKLEGIGAQLQQKDGEIKVSMLVPGSPCFLQGDLEVGDIILKAAEAEKEPTDLEDLLLREAIRHIRGPKGTEVRLTVRKIDGSIKEIPIVRDVVINKETYAKSTMINQNEKIGYIKLPRFYADFSDREGRSSSKDMRKEVIKLKEAGMKSLVIDLRNNGGGSLSDVVKIVGLFIDKGPVVQVKSYDKKSRVLADTEKGIVWDGPIVVMINHGSASASEILAAALQDYGRALIVGSEQSFGKGTVQRMIDLDRIVSPTYANLKPLGALKLTVEKFYRINGGATQIKGVESDIVLKNKYSYLDIGERERDYALDWDQIEQLNYTKVNADFNIEKELKQITKRLEKDPVFEYIDNKALEFKANKDDTKVPLELNKYTAEREEDDKNKDVLSELIKANRKPLVVENLKVDLPEIQSDSTLIKVNKKWLTSLEKDIYLNEVIEIIH